MEATHYNNLCIYRLINTPVSSNTYLVADRQSKHCFIIDPGTKEDDRLVDIIKVNDYYLDFIFLTHEHFDHCWGVNYLLQYFNPLIVSTLPCAKWLSIPRNYFNLLYYNCADFFSINNIHITIKRQIEEIIWCDKIIYCHITNGHTDKSMCVYIDSVLFSGDTLILNTMPVIKKRYGGSIYDFSKTISYIYNNFNDDVLVLPGHGEKFLLIKMMDFYKKNIGF